MSILQTIYDSGFAQFMRESLWGYPISLTVHSIGMGLLVGILTVIDLRLLGLFKKMPFQVMKPVIRVAMFGFIINLISGTLLFVADPVAYMANMAFIIKIIGVVVGLVILWVMVKTPQFKNIQGVEAAAVGNGALQVLAVVSLGVWIITMIAGRLIGYMQ